MRCGGPQIENDAGNDCRIELFVFGFILGFLNVFVFFFKC